MAWGHKWHLTHLIAIAIALFNDSKDVIMQHGAHPTVCKVIAVQLQRTFFIDTSFVNIYTINLLLEHRHTDRLVNFSRYMSSIKLFVAELLLIIPNIVGKLKVKSLHQNTINITFILRHAHLRRFVIMGGGGDWEMWWHNVHFCLNLRSGVRVTS